VVERWEAKYVWLSLARVALFTRFECNCGSCTTAFSHWMLKQQHRTTRATTRYVRETAEISKETLPQETYETHMAFQVRKTPFCLDCLDFRNPGMTAFIVES
jgi:hypothetical protein